MREGQATWQLPDQAKRKSALDDVPTGIRIGILPWAHNPDLYGIGKYPPQEARAQAHFIAAQETQRTSHGQASGGPENQPAKSGGPSGSGATQDAAESGRRVPGTSGSNHSGEKVHLAAPAREAAESEGPGGGGGSGEGQTLALTNI